jgi:hypothetical protein
MPTLTDFFWKPPVGTPYVEYYLFLRLPGETTWNPMTSVKHPRCTAVLPNLVVGQTYECTILSKTRMGVWNTFEGSTIHTFTVGDNSPIPSAPSGFALAPRSYGFNDVLLAWTPGANTYYMQVWWSFVNDRDSAILAGEPVCNQPLNIWGYTANPYGWSIQFTSADAARYIYCWIRPKSYWAKLGDFYPFSRFEGLLGYVVPETPPVDTGR